jgi:hypothetical protein
VRGRRLVLGAAVIAALVLALVAGAVGRVGAGESRHDSAPCHAQVNCIGQVANAPLGASTLPVGFVAVALALMVVTRADVRPVRWHDRLAANRLFRPPRLLG